MKLKVLAPLMAYAAIVIGLFWMRSAWGTLLGFHVVLVGSLLIAKPNIPIASLFKSSQIKWVALSILLCGSSGILLYLLWPHLGIADDLPAQLETIRLTSSTWPGFIAYFALVNPFIEEYFWRGYLGSMSKKFSIYDAIYSGYHALVLIGKVHVASILLAFIILTFAGWFWRQATRADNGLLAAVLGHMAGDLSILGTIWWMCTR
jgi:membrane protease YdiL (CAAX protease family)